MVDYQKKVVYVEATYQRAQFVPLVCFAFKINNRRNLTQIKE